MSSQKKDQNNEDQVRQHLLSVTLKALKDQSYKERLLANPTKAIQEVYPKFKVEGEGEIVIQDQTDTNTLYLNISSLEAGLLYESIEDFELSEEDLEMVAGGQQLDNGNCGCTVTTTNGWQCWFN